MKKKKFILILSTLILAISFLNPIKAQVGVGTPHQFFGTVTYLDGPAPDGLSVVAKIDGEEVASTTTLNGKYGYSPYIFYIEDPENNRYNETIYFFVNGVQANEDAKFYNGESTRHDLTLNANVPVTTTIPPSGPTGGPSGRRRGTTTTTTTIPEAECGNDVCEYGETCSNCPVDCGVCPIVNITVVNLIIPENVTADEPFILQVVVKNAGDEEGFDDVTISIPTGWSTSIWGHRVTLKPKAAKTLYFTITPNEDSGEIAAGTSEGFLVSDTIYPLKFEEPEPMGITGLVALLTSLSYWWVVLIIVIILILIYLAGRKPSRKKPYTYKYKSKKK